MDQDRIDQIADTLDDIATTLDELKAEQQPLSPECCDRLRQSVEKATEAIDRLDNRQPGGEERPG